MAIYNLICKKCGKPFEHEVLHNTLSEKKKDNIICPKCKYIKSQQAVKNYQAVNRDKYLQMQENFRETHKEQIHKDVVEAKEFYKKKLEIKKTLKYT